jgi:hypothetical protein
MVKQMTKIKCDDGNEDDERRKVRDSDGKQGIIESTST